MDSEELPVALQDPPEELTALRDATLEATDPRRVQRGLAGHRAGAVQGAWYGPDWVLGRVRGKQGVQVTTARLWRGQLEAECDCVDTVTPCAHVPAVLAAAIAGAGTPTAEGGPVEWREHWSHGALPGAAEAVEAVEAAEASTPPTDVAGHLARAPGGDLLELLGPLYRELR